MWIGTWIGDICPILEPDTDIRSRRSHYIGFICQYFQYSRQVISSDFGKDTN